MILLVDVAAVVAVAALAAVVAGGGQWLHVMFFDQQQPFISHAL